MNQQPHPAYSVRNGSQRDYWTRVGAAFPNRNGGFTLLLEAVPASKDGSIRIVVQPPQAQSQATGHVDEFDDPYFPFMQETAAPVRRRTTRRKS